MSDGTGLVVALLELHGFRVLEVTEMNVVITIETVATVVGCEGCGTRAGSPDRVGGGIRRSTTR